MRNSEPRRTISIQRTTTVRAAICALLSLGAAAPVFAADASADEVSELRTRLEEQEQKIKVLERKLELDAEAKQSTASSTPAVKAGPRGFSFGTPDNANTVKLRGVLHFDGRRYFDDITPATADTFLLRRVRPTLEGTLNGIFDFRFTPDFAGGRTIILDAFLAARLAPEAVITAGKFKVPVGLERIVSANDLRFIERGFPTSLLPNRDLGVQLGGDLAGGAVTYSIGYFNGVTDGGSSDASGDVESDTSGDWAARLFFQPFVNSDSFALRGLGFGVAGTYVDSTGSATATLLPGYRTPGQQNFFSYRSTTAASGTTPGTTGTFADGERLRITPQAYYTSGSFLALAEYVQVSQDVSRDTPTSGRRSDSLEHTAWQLQLGYFLTGEEQAIRGYKPSSVFSPKNGTWGAWELVARYHELDIDDDAFVGGADSFANPATAASKASAWGVGVNWYLNQNYKWSLNYDVTSFEGGAASGDRPDEKALFTRFAVGF